MDKAGYSINVDPGAHSGQDEALALQAQSAGFDDAALHGHLFLSRIH